MHLPISSSLHGMCPHISFFPNPMNCRRPAATCIRRYSPHFKDFSSSNALKVQLRKKTPSVMGFVSKEIKKRMEGFGTGGTMLGGERRAISRLGLHTCCWLGNASHASGEQPHPSTTNLMAGFQCGGQDARGWGGRLARRGKKARKCHRGEDAFSGWAKACFVSLPSASCHFLEAGSVTKK